ncbi:protein disulfide oxidoreductase [Vibrio japonicus]|uniref:Protein disulfide oxidoreductase n=1 Tax=Vibrio japonicus TaxID=1824638 RepID=A0ABY5LQL1_9VIBR|nr:protein disulfide oxidoreductase [Vibrio japonicus]UUM33004.1 protein disulfide oxidoreductase [Vibrio japonicus]
MKKSLRHWVKEIIIYVVIGMAIVAGVDLYRSQDMPKTIPADFTVQTLDGQSINIVEASYEAPVVVYFWATWCGACKFVSPSVSWLDQYYQVVAVSSASGSDQRVAQFMEAKDYQFNNTNDPNNVLMREWGVKVTPTIFIINKGQVENITTGISTPFGIAIRVWLSK